MYLMKQPRKPLRQRVADRKAGRDKPVENETSKRWRKRVAIVGNGLQVVALLLLAAELLPLANGDFGAVIEWDRIVGLAVVFVAGRILRAGSDILRSMGRGR